MSLNDLVTVTDESSIACHGHADLSDKLELAPTSIGPNDVGRLEHADMQSKSFPNRKDPLQLLDLPMDILKEIIKEVTHTNDLTSLALTHSALHCLAIPYIYSRFDIVWPETQVNTDPRTGVDALTYGLSTLVMSHDVFGETMPGGGEHSSFQCNHCGMLNQLSAIDYSKHLRNHNSRKGNDYGRHTRKFSLGNGPPDWVQEYLISKESGKMLGTLVALAIARMENLESFMWDMPTGVLRDVWAALCSSSNRRRDQPPRLERIWVRWHNNKLVVLPANPPQHGMLHQSQQHHSHGPEMAPQHGVSGPFRGLVPDTLLARSYRNVEHPNLSILPPLKSINVLDIDEPAYLNELSILVERSVDRLRELRIGAASISLVESWTGPDPNGAGLPKIPDPSMDYAACGGMLGMIMSKLYDCRRQRIPILRLAQDLSEQSTVVSGPDPAAAASAGTPADNRAVDQTILPSLLDASTEECKTQPMVPIQSTSQALLPRPATSPGKVDRILDSGASPLSEQQNPNIREPIPVPRSQLAVKHRKLRLEVLELEKVSISVQVLQRTIDWTVLTSLTLLNCESDELLWKSLRRTFSPQPRRIAGPFSSPVLSRHESHPHLRTASMDLPSLHSDYALKLKRIHTNNVSPALIAFLKETLAPNSLEWLFLQDREVSGSKVTIDAIYRGPLRRHRSSLKKVLIDSGDRRPRGNQRNERWKKWMLTGDVLSFVTSGKMSSLRELSIAVDYKDWHFFLQRLPQVSHLRSLYIPHIADHVHAHHLDAKELALQIVDIVTLRPEVELCYMGILTKCFEILESKAEEEVAYPYNDNFSNHVSAAPGNSEDDSDLDDDENGDEDDEDDEGPAVPAPADEDGNNSDEADESDGVSEDDGLVSDEGRKKAKLRLREILFYDDKVSIFRARHGKL